MIVKIKVRSLNDPNTPLEETLESKSKKSSSKSCDIFCKIPVKKGKDTISEQFQFPALAKQPLTHKIFPGKP